MLALLVQKVLLAMLALTDTRVPMAKGVQMAIQLPH